MLAVYIGKDSVNVRANARTYIQQREAEGMSISTILPEEYVAGNIVAFVSRTSLFGGTECVVLDTLSLAHDALDEVASCVHVLAESPHHVVVIDTALPTALTKLLEKNAHTWFVSKDRTETRFNTFALADALAAKDRKALWVLFQQAMGEGITAEELTGTLFWQLKALRLAKITNTPEEADMKVFPYSKAKRASITFTTNELVSLSERLIDAHHAKFRGKDTLLQLERWVLTL
jgi:DNA polymerase III delta subunit